MKLVEINWNPTDRQLRQFGALAALFLPGLAWIWGGSRTTIGWLLAFGLAVAAVGWIRPRVLKPLFVGMTLAAIPLGMVVGEVAMLTIYFAVFLPIGLVFRIKGRDNLRLKRERSATTYWAPKRQPTGVGSYYRQG